MNCRRPSTGVRAYPPEQILHRDFSRFGPRDLQAGDLDHQYACDSRPGGVDVRERSPLVAGVTADRALPGNHHVAGFIVARLGIARAAKHAGHLAGNRRIFRAVPRLIEVVLAVEGRLIKIREDGNPPTVHGPAVVVRPAGGRKVCDYFVVQQGQRDLFEVVLA